CRAETAEGPRACDLAHLVVQLRPADAASAVAEPDELGSVRRQRKFHATTGFHACECLPASRTSGRANRRVPHPGAPPPPPRRRPLPGGLGAWAGFWTGRVPPERGFLHEEIPDLLHRTAVLWTVRTATRGGRWTVWKASAVIHT